MYLTKVCTQMMNYKHCKLCTVHILQITEQIIVLFLVKVKCYKLSSNLETTKTKKAPMIGFHARSSQKTSSQPVFHNPLIIMRHKLDASFCSDDWFETGRTNDRANCSLHFFRTDKCEIYNSNVEPTKSAEDTYATYLSFSKIDHLHLFLVTPLCAQYYQGIWRCGLRKFQGPDFESSKQII